MKKVSFISEALSLSFGSALRSTNKYRAKIERLWKKLNHHRTEQYELAELKGKCEQVYKPAEAVNRKRMETLQAGEAERQMYLVELGRTILLHATFFNNLLLPRNLAAALAPLVHILT